MKLHAPQIIWLVLAAAALLLEANRHGKPKEGKYNLWTSIAAVAISFGLLWWGGFFR